MKIIKFIKKGGRYKTRKKRIHNKSFHRINSNNNNEVNNNVYRLSINNISRCNPSKRRDTVRKTKTHSLSSAHDKCLPNTVYNKIHDSPRIKKDVYKQCSSKDEHCILDHAPLSQQEKMHLRKEYLRPRMPKDWEDDPDMWLDNYNIAAIMKQYEDAYKWFKFIGNLPIDFSTPNPYRKDVTECLKQEVCSLNLRKEYSEGKRGIGFVFNLDPHYKSGSHWVALYIDIHNIDYPEAMYFDSYGMDVPPMIARFMKSLTLQNPNIFLMYNGRRSQYSNTECGMYSLYFIINMINGVPFRKFVKRRIPDKDMLELRKVIFQR